MNTKYREMFKFGDPFKIVESSNLKSLRSILKKKPGCIHKTRNGDTLLHVAAETENSDTIEVLLHHGAKVNRQNNVGRTALHISCSAGHWEGVLVLREHDADPSIKCFLGNNALHEASKSGHIRIIKYLFNYDFDTNAQNLTGWTALHKAVHANHLDAVEILLHKGIDFKLKTSSTKPQTASQMAHELMRYDIAAEIEKYEYKPSLNFSIKEDENRQKVSIVNVTKALNKGKSKISNFFRLDAESTDDNNIPIPKTTEIKPITSESLSTIKDTQQSASQPVNFFTATQDRFKNLLKSQNASETTSSISDLQRQGEEQNETEDNEINDSSKNDSTRLNQDHTSIEEPQNIENEKEIQESEEEELEGEDESKENIEQPKSSFFKIFKSNKKGNVVSSSPKQNNKHSNESIDSEDTGECDDFEGAEEKDHECPVCFEILLPPTHVYQFTNGHLYCGTCSTMPNV